MAQATLAPAFGRWLDVEQALRAVLADDPENSAAIAALASQLMSVGRVREAMAANGRLIAAEPFSPAVQYRHVYHLWNAGRLAEMDRVADRAMHLWPRHSGTWFARLWTLAFTGRSALALAHINDGDARPPLSSDHTALLRSSMAAFASGDSQVKARAVIENVAAARAAAQSAINAVMILTHLGDLDAAFAVADGYLRRRGVAAGPLRVSSGAPAASEQRRRKTMMLFVPVTAQLRSDRRFIDLCQAVGLSDYWCRSRTRPDFLRT